MGRLKTGNGKTAESLVGAWNWDRETQNVDGDVVCWQRNNRLSSWETLWDKRHPPPLFLFKQPCYFPLSFCIFLNDRIFFCMCYMDLQSPSFPSVKCIHQQGQRLGRAGNAHWLAPLPRGPGCRLGPQEHLLDRLGQQEHLRRHRRRPEEKSADSDWAERAAGHRGGSAPRVSRRSFKERKKFERVWSKNGRRSGAKGRDVGKSSVTSLDVLHRKSCFQNFLALSYQRFF